MTRPDDKPWPDSDMLEAAMGIICNVDSGNWAIQRPEWREAAERWIAAYHRQLKAPDDRTEPATVR